MQQTEIDRTIPFYNVILKCKSYVNSNIILTPGYYFKNYKSGDEISWAKLEYEIGDFESIDMAKEYFLSNYCANMENISNRCFFVLNNKHKIVGSCIAWSDKKSDDTVASLHWLVVLPAEQGKGLGKALCQKVMETFYEKNEFSVYIHTQPWRYKAILLYIKLGFKLQIKDTFENYKNEYNEAVAVLKNILTKQNYEKLISNSEI
jgi:Acetyltransferases